ncbi:hypothetical protein GCM10027046_17020 [Uliginosibacterium flavum]
MSISDQKTSWLKRFLRVLWPCFWLKAIGTSAFTTVFFLGYVHLLKHPYAPVTIMPRTLLDDWISFQPLALLPYVSLWVYVSTPPMFMVRHREIIAYGVRAAVLCGLGLAFFYLWPTAVPLADIDWARYPGVAFLKGVDAAGNACPSLHVATAVFSAIWLHQLLRAFGTGRMGLVFNWLWCLAIAYSTLATKQHVAVDVLAGAALGAGVAWLSLLKIDGFQSLTVSAVTANRSA